MASKLIFLDVLTPQRSGFKIVSNSILGSMLLEAPEHTHFFKKKSAKTPQNIFDLVNCDFGHWGPQNDQPSGHRKTEVIQSHRGFS